MLKKLLAYPLTRDLYIDDPRTTELRRRIVREKPFLRRLYTEWYDILGRTVPPGAGALLELGSGGGFMDERLPDVITSEVFYCAGPKLVLDARRIPFSDASLRGILMVDVFHHIPDVESFLAEAVRCLRPGGVVAMIEPWVTSWSRLIYTFLHHEPFKPEATAWNLPEVGPLSGANGALPWITFQRDRDRYRRLYPCLRLVKVEPGFPFSYLVSGGVSLRSLSPGVSFALWRGLERLLSPAMDRLAMFALIVLRKE